MVQRLFQRKQSAIPRLVGVIHVGALPGSARWAGNMSELKRRALEEGQIYQDAGFDGIILENMHDVPYLRGYVESETTAAMSILAHEVRQKTAGMAVGVQLLAGANREALAVAVAAQLDFIRVEAFAYAHVADEGLLEASAALLLRARAALNADGIEVLADIKKKHSAHAITADLSLRDVAEGSEFCRADGLIVSGLATGKAPAASAVLEVKHAVSIPVLVGSGITAENIGEFVGADGLIVGTFCKIDGNWQNSVDPARARKLRQALSHAAGQISG